MKALDTLDKAIGLDPVQRLWAAVIVRALEDAYSPLPGRFKNTAWVKGEAKRFLGRDAAAIADACGVGRMAFNTRLNAYTMERQS